MGVREGGRERGWGERGWKRERGDRIEMGGRLGSEERGRPSGVRGGKEKGWEHRQCTSM